MTELGRQERMGNLFFQIAEQSRIKMKETEIYLSPFCLSTSCPDLQPYDEQKFLKNNRIFLKLYYSRLQIKANYYELDMSELDKFKNTYLHYFLLNGITEIVSKSEFLFFQLLYGKFYGHPCLQIATKGRRLFTFIPVFKSFLFWFVWQGC